MGASRAPRGPGGGRVKAAYLLIDAASVAFPLAFAASDRFGFGRSWPRALAAVALAAVPFALWDIAFARAGIWDFNPRYLLGPSLFGLPAEEWSFFLAIPFACLFIYRRFAAIHHAERFASRRPGRAFALGCAAISLACASVALLHAERAYTLWVGLAAAAASAALALGRPLYARPLLFALAVQYIPFLLVNGFLTALPVVRYRADAILGPRILSIPVEDAIYAFVMFVLPVSFYEALTGRGAEGRPSDPAGDASEAPRESAEGARAPRERERA